MSMVGLAGVSSQEEGCAGEDFGVCEGLSWDSAESDAKRCELLFQELACAEVGVLREDDGWRWGESRLR